MRISDMSAKRVAANLVAAWEAPAGCDAAFALDTAVDLMVMAEVLRERAVYDMRQQGVTWSEIGERMGMTRQGAQQRFGK